MLNGYWELGGEGESVLELELELELHLIHWGSSVTVSPGVTIAFESLGRFEDRPASDTAMSMSPSKSTVGDWGGKMLLFSSSLL